MVEMVAVEEMFFYLRIKMYPIYERFISKNTGKQKMVNQAVAVIKTVREETLVSSNFLWVLKSGWKVRMKSCANY